jgi:transcriptional regulator with XRE-family HTH domain
MGVAGAELMPAAGQERVIDDPPYLWSDLLARRNALALRREDLAPILRVDESKYRARETGTLPVGPYLVEELLAMEDFVARQASAVVAAAASAGTVVLNAITDQDEFNLVYPDARTLRDDVPYPLILQRVAVGRAAAELTRRRRDVEVYTGDRRADLTVRRLAAGLEKNETADLLGVEKKHYYTWERGAKTPSPGLLAELQAIDDFITASAAKLDITDVDGVSTILMIDDQSEFELTYPKARTLRDGAPYPLRVHRVAAARRAGKFDAAGEQSRIATTL